MGALLIVGLLLSAGTAVALESDNRAATKLITNKNAQSPQLFLNGILVLQDSATASIAIQDRTQSNWYGPNAVVGNFVIVSINKDSVQLRDRETGKTKTLHLQASTIQESTPDKSTLYTKAWINSNENPMLHRRHPMPTEVLKNWSNLTAKERNEIAEYYLKHGWRLVSAEVDDSGAANFIWENIYSEERSRVMQDNRRKFIDSLDPEQRANWEAANSRQRIVASKEGFTDAEKQEIVRRRELHQRFLGTLSPQQRASFDGIGDFTKHDWKE
jgi:hypothetical protein